MDGLMPGSIEPELSGMAEPTPSKVCAESNDPNRSPHFCTSSGWSALSPATKLSRIVRTGLTYQRPSTSVTVMAKGSADAEPNAPNSPKVDGPESPDSLWGSPAQTWLWSTCGSDDDGVSVHSPVCGS